MDGLDDRWLSSARTNSLIIERGRIATKRLALAASICLNHSLGRSSGALEPSPSNKTDCGIHHLTTRARASTGQLSLCSLTSTRQCTTPDVPHRAKPAFNPALGSRRDAERERPRIRANRRCFMGSPLF